MIGFGNEQMNSEMQIFSRTLLLIGKLRIRKEYIVIQEETCFFCKLNMVISYEIVKACKSLLYIKHKYL